MWRLINAGGQLEAGGEERGAVMICRNGAESTISPERWERYCLRWGQSAADCFLMTCQFGKDRLFVCAAGCVSLSHQCHLSLFSCSRQITPL